ncbi:MAG: hypothetical protein K0M49_17185, partial [Arenimonas sp.]|nr:hypothetical protein [Arenimonas sp.]
RQLAARHDRRRVLGSPGVEELQQLAAGTGVLAGAGAGDAYTNMGGPIGGGFVFGGALVVVFVFFVGVGQALFFLGGR